MNNMNKEQLEIAKKIAELECFYFEGGDVLAGKKGYSLLVTIGTQTVFYNPFDWSILGPLMVKYKVEPDYDSRYVQIYNNPLEHYIVDFENESEIPRAILECILKSQVI